MSRLSRKVLLKQVLLEYSATGQFFIDAICLTEQSSTEMVKVL